MSYKHAATLTSSGTSTSYTFSPRPFRGLIAVQCSGGDARLAFGSGSATAANNAGVRIIADSSPEPVSLAGNEDTVAVILDVNSAGPVTVEVMTAAPAAVQVTQ